MDKQMPPERFFTVADVAEQLNVHVVTVRRWIRSGQLPALQFARKTGYRIREHDLAAFLQRLETESAEEEDLWGKTAA